MLKFWGFLEVQTRALRGFQVLLSQGDGKKEQEERKGSEGASSEERRRDGRKRVHRSWRLGSCRK